MIIFYFFLYSTTKRILIYLLKNEREKKKDGEKEILRKGEIILPFLVYCLNNNKTRSVYC